MLTSSSLLLFSSANLSRSYEKNNNNKTRIIDATKESNLLCLLAPKCALRCDGSPDESKHALPPQVP